MSVNWPEYNEKLVRRGEFFINPNFLKNWNKELKEMNSGKVGEPYHYPESMIEFLGILHVKNFDYRALEGIVRSLSQNLHYSFPVINYSQICRRVNKLKVSFQTNEKNLVVAIDGSGEKVSNRGEWIRQRWGKRRGWIKVVVMGANNGEIVDIRIGNEKMDERKSARGMLRKNYSKIDKVLMDGLHDCRKTFNLCDEKNIETGIKVRKNSRTRSKGSPRRRREVVEYQSLGHNEWVKEKGYGYRWPNSEGIFSGSKRILGEHVRAKKKRNMYKEIRLKYWTYNQLQKV